MEYLHIIIRNWEYSLSLLGFIIVCIIIWPSKKIILQPELIPYSMHYKNVRAVLSDEDWKKITKIKYKESNYKCDICNINSRLECHEVWDFNDRKLTQSLIGLTCLCRDCHRVKHIGLAKKMGWYGETLEHMCKVNKISRNKARKIIEYAELEVKKRKDEYQLDLTLLNQYKNILPRKYSKNENGNCLKINGNY